MPSGRHSMSWPITAITAAILSASPMALCAPRWWSAAPPWTRRRTKPLVGPGTGFQAPVRGLRIRRRLTRRRSTRRRLARRRSIRRQKKKYRKAKNQFPPQPPRRAGGPEVGQTTPTANGRRGSGTNPRAAQANPRAEADLADTARLEAQAAARRAELERVTEDRQAADHAAEVEAERLEAEALAVSAALPDGLLAAVVDVVGRGMAGPLAASPLALSRAVLSWCRAGAPIGGRARCRKR
jgi:hypothetical protein